MSLRRPFGQASLFSSSDLDEVASDRCEPCGITDLRVPSSATGLQNLVDVFSTVLVRCFKIMQSFLQTGNFSL